MPRSKINQLSDKTIASKTATGYYGDGGGLFLQVSKSGTKSWVFRFTSPETKKAREMGLGAYITVSLASARLKAREARILVDAGKDPIIERQTIEAQKDNERKAKSATFETVAKECIEVNATSWTNPKHRAQWARTLETYAYPIIGNMPVGEIEESDILRVLQPIWHEKHETASRLRGRIEKVLDYATAKKKRTGVNPAQWKGGLKELLGKQAKEVINQPALPYSRMAEFVSKLRTHTGNAAKALEFVILTACRSGEARLATWDEFDLEQKRWTIPAGRMKAKKQHVVALSDSAIELLTNMPRLADCDFVFFSPTGKAYSDMALTKLIRDMHAIELKAGEIGFIDPETKDNEGNFRVITAHGFRSTFRTWAGDTTSHAREVIEKSLAHGIKDKAEEAYARGKLFEKRMMLMQSWASHCSPANHGQVLPIRAKK